MKSRYTGLWMLLVLALLTITIISFLEKDINILGVKIKKSPIAEKLTTRYLSSEEKKAVEVAKLAELEEKVKPQENPIDTSSQVFLFIGDSMTQNLALRASAYARQNGHKIHTVNWDSSGTRIWAQSDTLDGYIERFKPTFIFISLGSNELYIRNLDPYREHVKTILSKIGDIPYVWIGPPNWKPDEGINDMLMDETAPGTFFLSEGIELARKRDKIHPTREASALWFDSVARWIPKSAHPIRLETPSDSITSSSRLSHTNIIYLKAKH